MGKATFPTVVAVSQTLVRCELTLARRNTDNKLHTVVLVRDDGVLFIGPDGDLTHGDLDYFYDQYTIIRPYKTGEKLTITV